MKRPKQAVYVQAAVFYMIAQKLEDRGSERTVGEVADILHVSRQTVLNMIERYNGKMGFVAYRDEGDKRGTYILSFRDYVMRDDTWIEFKQAWHELQAYNMYKFITGKYQQGGK